jgi:hypothetical protein
MRGGPNKHGWLSGKNLSTSLMLGSTSGGGGGTTITLSVLDADDADASHG